MLIYNGVFVFPSAKKAGWQDLSKMNAGIPVEYAINALEVCFVSKELNAPLSNKTWTNKSEKLKKTTHAGIEKNNPILKEVISSLENCLASLLELDFESDVSNTEPNATPIIPKGSCAILSAK